MSIVLLPRRLFATSVVLALIPVLLSAAPAPEAKDQSRPSPAENLRGKLEQPIAIEVKEGWTLQDVLDYLRDRYDLRFGVDEAAFDNEKVPPVRTTPIADKGAWSLNDTKLKEVLRTLLRKVPVDPSEATYVIIGNRIVITTSEWAKYRWMRQLVSLDCTKEDLSTVLKKLARETATNLVIDTRAAKEAATPVTLQVHDVALETAVSLLAEMADLKPVRIGNVLFLTTKKHAKAMRNDPDRAPLVGPCPLPPNDKISSLP